MKGHDEIKKVLEIPFDKVDDKKEFFEVLLKMGTTQRLIYVNKQWQFGRESINALRQYLADNGSLFSTHPSYNNLSTEIRLVVKIDNSENPSKQQWGNLYDLSTWSLAKQAITQYSHSDPEYKKDFFILQSVLGLLQLTSKRRGEVLKKMSPEMKDNYAQWIKMQIHSRERMKLMQGMGNVQNLYAELYGNPDKKIENPPSLDPAYFKTVAGDLFNLMMKELMSPTSPVDFKSALKYSAKVERIIEYLQISDSDHGVLDAFKKLEAFKNLSDTLRKEIENMLQAQLNNMRKEYYSPAYNPDQQAVWKSLRNLGQSLIANNYIKPQPSQERKLESEDKIKTSQQAPVKNKKKKEISAEQLQDILKEYKTTSKLAWLFTNKDRSQAIRNLRTLAQQKTVVTYDDVKGALAYSKKRLNLFEQSSEDSKPKKSTDEVIIKLRHKFGK